MMTASIVGVAPLTAPLRLASGARARASKRTIVVAHADRRATATSRARRRSPASRCVPPCPRPSQPCPAPSHVPRRVAVVSAAPCQTHGNVRPASLANTHPSHAPPPSPPAGCSRGALRAGPAAADSEPARSALAERTSVTQLAVAAIPRPRDGAIDRGRPRPHVQREYSAVHHPHR